MARTLKKTHEIEEELDTKELSPREVLQAKMHYYNKRAHKVAGAIIHLIKQQDKNRADLLVDLHRQMMKFDDLAIDCATRLAPYTHAKLSSMEVKSETKHTFVVRVPEVIKDTDSWLDKCTDKSKIIELTPEQAEIEKESIHGKPN